jgi:hypothetical protein
LREKVQELPPTTLTLRNFCFYGPESNSPPKTRLLNISQVPGHSDSDKTSNLDPQGRPRPRAKANERQRRHQQGMLTGKSLCTPFNRRQPNAKAPKIGQTPSAESARHHLQNRTAYGVQGVRCTIELRQLTVSMAVQGPRAGTISATVMEKHRPWQENYHANLVLSAPSEVRVKFCWTTVTTQSYSPLHLLTQGS